MLIPEFDMMLFMTVDPPRPRIRKADWTHYRFYLAWKSWSEQSMILSNTNR